MSTQRYPSRILASYVIRALKKRNIPFERQSPVCLILTGTRKQNFRFIDALFRFARMVDCKAIAYDEIGKNTILLTCCDEIPFLSSYHRLYQ